MFTIDLSKLEEVGENIEVGLVENKLVLVIDATETIGLSSTGKMMGVASTGGFIAVPGGMKLNLYLGKKVR